MTTEQHDRGKRGEMSAAESHERAMTLPIEVVVKELVAVLGATTVALIAGVSETRAVTQWMSGRMPQRANVLRFALQVSMMISDAHDPEVVRSWFHGSNPHLRDRTPAFMLRDDPLHEVQGEIMASARSFTAR